jgi:predicted ATPase
VLSSLIIRKLSPHGARHGNQQFVPIPEKSCYPDSIMKSAYELAMSRLEQSAPSRMLTEEQKAAIREIDSEYDAKAAERRIFLESEIAKSYGDPVAAESLRKQLSSELASIEEKREKRKEEVRRQS